MMILEAQVTYREQFDLCPWCVPAVTMPQCSVTIVCIRLGGVGGDHTDLTFLYLRWET